MKLGVCYYPEHWPVERWPKDARVMREAGLSLVRIGEFAWAKMEPDEALYSWDWLDQAIETLAEEGLQVVLGTPTPTPPAWLCKAHPDILPVDVQGRRRRFGSRRHYCANNPTYRYYTEKIVGAMAKRYGKRREVVGWQIDNEFGCHDTARCYCDVCANAFRRWLERRYGSLDALNLAWGTIFWSQTYSDWEQIYPPNLTVTEPNPSHMLDYYRFSSDSMVAYQQLQIDLLRQYTTDQFITHNLMGNFPDLDYHALARPLDFVCWDSYPTGYAEVQAESLYDPDEARPALAHDLGDPYVTGFCHDLTRGMKDKPFWVMEQQCGNINWAIYNTGVRTGAVRMWTWHALASGAEAVVYFRWRACLFAQEQHHSGLLRHDGSPATGYAEVKAMQEEHDLMKQVAGQRQENQVALLLSYHDLWAIQLQPHRRDFGYLRHLFLYYRALARLGIPADIVSYQADLSRYKLVIAPTIFLADDSLAERLTGYVEAGGTLLLGVRSGFKTASNLVVDQELPGALRSLVGAVVQEWHALPPGVGYDLRADISGLSGPAEIWAESLRPDLEEDGDRKKAVVLATYASGPFEGQAGLVERVVGNGRSLYVGWYPNLDQARAIVMHVASELGIPVWLDLPEGVIVIPRGPFTVWLNFSESLQRINIKSQIQTLLPRNLLVLPQSNIL